MDNTKKKIEHLLENGTLKHNLYILLYIREIALSSERWIYEAPNYYGSMVYTYAPMVKDELFLSYFKEKDTIGVVEMESILGRALKVEELKVCPLSVPYLLFGNPSLTNSREEYDILCSFYKLIIQSIKKQETRYINYKIKRLNHIVEESEKWYDGIKASLE